MESTVTMNKEQMVNKMKEINKRNNANKEQKENILALFKNSQQVGDRVYIEMPLKHLRVDTEVYQRTTQKHWKHICQNWSMDKCDDLIVNYRDDGYFYVMDGQHRLQAARAKGIESLNCRCFVGLTVKEEAKWYAEQNKGTKGLSPFDSYKANIVYGEPVDTAIKDVCDCYKIKVEKTNAPNVLRGLTVTRKLVKADGKDCLHWIFNTVVSAGWNDYKEGFTYDTMYSLWNVYISCESNRPLAQERLINFMKFHTPKNTFAMASITYPDLGDHTRIVKFMKNIARNEIPVQENNVIDLKTAM